MDTDRWHDFLKEWTANGKRTITRATGNFWFALNRKYSTILLPENLAYLVREGLLTQKDENHYTYNRRTS